MNTTSGNYNYIYKIGNAWYANVICEFDGEPLVGSKDEIMVLGDWSNWDDYGYVIGRTGDVWTLIKVTQFPEPNNIVIKTKLHSVDEALGIVGLESLNEFNNYEGFNWEKRY